MTIRSIPLPAGNEVAGMGFAPADDALYVVLNTEVVNVWAVLTHFWPEVWASVVALFLLSAACRAWRETKRRWRRESRCPACGYDVTGLSGRCSECGRDLSRAVGVGDRAIQRHVFAPAAGILLLGLGIALLPFALGAPRDWSPLSTAIECRSTAMARFAARHAGLAPLNQSAIELRRITPGARTSERVGLMDGRALADDTFARTLSESGWAVVLVGTPKASQVTAVSLATGTVIGRYSRLPSDWETLPGLSPDGREVFVALREGNTNVIKAWDPCGGVIRPVTVTAAPVRWEEESLGFCGLMPTRREVPIAYALRATHCSAGARFLMTHVVSDAGVTRCRMTVTDESGATLRTTETSLPGPILMRPDGACIGLVLWGPRIIGPDGIPEDRIEQAPGTSEGELSHLTLSPDGTRLTLVQYGPRHPPRIHVWDMTTDRYLGHTPIPAVPGRFALSNDGRYAALEINGAGHSLAIVELVP
ncbi:MAG: hypothetical protein KDA21_10780 [Phycisphaerales bacterium]|nr:hypothetical protein [Phycisphaerales bacterium]